MSVTGGACQVGLEYGLQWLPCGTEWQLPSVEHDQHGFEQRNVGADPGFGCAAYAIMQIVGRLVQFLSESDWNVGMQIHILPQMNMTTA